MSDRAQKNRRLLALVRDLKGATYRLRIEPFLPALERRGITSDVVELADGVLARMAQLRRARDYDAVLLQKKTVSGLLASSFARSCKRLIYDFDDAIMYKSRPSRRPDRAKQRRFARTLALSDAVIAGNDILEGHASERGAKNVTVIPTCLDPWHYTPKADYRLGSPPVMVWIGSASTLNQVSDFGESLNGMGRAVPGLVFRIVADAALELADLRVQSVPWTLDGEARALAEADFAIAPMPDSQFTRGKCGFKVLQYLAAGLPVITSPVGVNAQFIKPGQTGLWAEEPRQWAEQAAKLLADESLRETLGRAGRQFVLEHMDYRLWEDTFCRVIEDALARPDR
jgi:glycosyltransferase involved in cell wall biosynthesis